MGQGRAWNSGWVSRAHSDSQGGSVVHLTEFPGVVVELRVLRGAPGGIQRDVLGSWVCTDFRVLRGAPYGIPGVVTEFGGLRRCALRNSGWAPRLLTEFHVFWARGYGILDGIPAHATEIGWGLGCVLTECHVERRQIHYNGVVGTQSTKLSGSYGIVDRSENFFGIVRGSYGIVRGSYGIVRGSYGIDRGSYGIVRGSYGILAGAYGIVRIYSGILGGGYGIVGNLLELSGSLMEFWGGTTEFSGILWNCLGISRNSGGWAQEFSGEGYCGTLQSALMEFLWGGVLVLWNSRGNVDCSRGLYGIHQRSDWS